MTTRISLTPEPLQGALTPGSEATPRFYYATLTDSAGVIATNCFHAHRTRDAAERCAAGWLLRAARNPR